MLKKYLEYVLRKISTLILIKYKPEIIAITGSVGKTSAKEAVYQVLKMKFEVRKNIKNYNNEIGLPLSIIGEETGGRSIFKWIKILFKGIVLYLKFDSHYPKILVLEMGADHPGDLQYLASFIKPKISVVTGVSATHLEFFKNIDAVAEEKSVIIKILSPDSLAVLNFDDHRVKEMVKLSQAKIFTYGLSPESDIRARNVEIINESGVFSIHLEVAVKGVAVDFKIKNTISKHLAYSILPAFAIGLNYNLRLDEISKSLENWQPPKGRMNIIAGIKNTILIDDTYNSSPLAALAALKTLAELPVSGLRIAILGDMLELGILTEQSHREVGEAVVKYGIDYLMTVGEISRDIARAALDKGMDKDRVFTFADTAAAGKFIQNRLQKNNIVLIKGSQGARMEKIVKELMAEPEDADKLLVRQDKPWV